MGSPAEPCHEWYGLRFCDCHATKAAKGRGPFEVHTLADVVLIGPNFAGQVVARLRCGAVVAWGKGPATEGRA